MQTGLLSSPCDVRGQKSIEIQASLPQIPKSAAVPLDSTGKSTRGLIHLPLMPILHRRRDETVELRRVGSRAYSKDF